MKIIFERGDTLIAIHQCIMDHNNLPALEIGRKYTVIESDDKRGRFTIIDDFGDEHEFSYDVDEVGGAWHEYFSIANPK